MIAAVLTILVTVFLYVVVSAQLWWWADKCEAEWRRPPRSDFEQALARIEHTIIQFAVVLTDALTPAVNEITAVFSKFAVAMAEAFTTAASPETGATRGRSPSARGTDIEAPVSGGSEEDA